MRPEAPDVDLTGFVDMHIHTAPDVRSRLLDDVEAAQQAAQAGMRAVVLKSHVTCTADRAALAEKRVPQLQVFGGVALNDPVGGLNPAAVETALQFGARIVWMPTLSASNHVRAQGGPTGIYILDTEGQVLPVVEDILRLIAARDALLATGHLSVLEVQALARAARAAGVRRVVVTHPEAPWIDMPVDVQEELRDLGVYFERCYVSTLPDGGAVPLARMAADLRRVGVSSTVLATDLGQVGNPAPVEGLRAYLTGLLGLGLAWSDVCRMGAERPAALLDLDQRGQQVPEVGLCTHRKNEDQRESSSG